VATALHSMTRTSTGCNPSPQGKEETERRKAGEGAGKEEKKRTTPDDRRSIEAAGREHEPVMNEHERDDRRNRDRDDDNRHGRRGERRLAPSEDRP